MSEPLDLELIAEIIGSYCPAHETGVDPGMIAEAVLDEISPEVERLRAELARRDQQITHLVEQRERRDVEIASALFAAWDDGNAVGLDGWIGPERGEEPDEHAIQARNRFVANQFAALDGPS